MVRKKISMALHQLGASAQQARLQVWATKINGVIKQWIKQRKLAIAPKLSDFFVRIMVWIFDDATKIWKTYESATMLH